jgi:hypothetical protein
MNLLYATSFFIINQFILKNVFLLLRRFNTIHQTKPPYLNIYSVTLFMLFISIAWDYVFNLQPPANNSWKWTFVTTNCGWELVQTVCSQTFPVSTKQENLKSISYWKSMHKVILILNAK